MAKPPDVAKQMPPEPNAAAALTKTDEISPREKRALDLLKPGPNDFCCLKCGFVNRGGKGETIHSCDPTQIVVWNRKTTPPVLAGQPRPMLALRRNGDEFDVVFVPAVEVSGMRVLSQRESLDYAIQKITDVLPDELPFDHQ